MSASLLMVDRIEAAVEHVLDTVPGDLVLGVPPGVGKPEAFVDALLRRVRANPTRRLRVVTVPSPLRPAPGTQEVAAVEPPEVNVVAQAVAMRGEGDALRLSLSGSPDVAFGPRGGRPPLRVAVVNRQLPFMPNGAEVSRERFDLLLTDAAATQPLRGPSSRRVSPADYAIALHAASLVVDGGTLQIGIGAPDEAIAQALIVRHRHGEEFRRILARLTPDGLAGREIGHFDQGLHGCSELFGNGLLQLVDAGIVRREVFGDAVLQQLIDAGRIPAVSVTPETLAALRDAGRVNTPLEAADLAFLKRLGILRPEVRLDGETLLLGSQRCSARLDDGAAFETVCRYMLGTRLAGGICLHSTFFLGPQAFYERLRTMTPQQLARLDMSPIECLGQLDPGQAELKRAQLRRARFLNRAPQITLLGAAASAALESAPAAGTARGVHAPDFAAMAHALPDARLVTIVRAAHDGDEGVTSGVVWNDALAAIAREHRDVVVTEYGVADLRGQPDTEVVRRLVAVADSRFQAALVRQARAHDKLPGDYVVPERYRHNLPEALEDKLQPWSQAGLLPDFPFGTDLADAEIHALERLGPSLARALPYPGGLRKIAGRL